MKGIGAAIQVGEGGRLLVATIDPLIIKSLQSVRILIECRVGEVERGKIKGDHVLFIGKTDGFEVAALPHDGFPLVEYLKVGNDYRRDSAVDLHHAGLAKGNSAGSTNEEVALAVEENRPI